MHLGHAFTQDLAKKRASWVLELTERFASWFERMLAYGFSEFIDFEKCKVFNASNRELEDYFVSIDMAKEISMIQRSDKGMQASQYSIECKRKAVAIDCRKFTISQNWRIIFASNGSQLTIPKFEVISNRYR